MKLEIKNLTFSYKNKEILNNISFEVYSGTLLSILGANGAGKTTLIKCINGILNFKKGEVLIDEKNFNNKSLKAKSKIMSYVPQITSSFDIDLTVFDTVLLGRVPHKTFKFSEWDKQIALNNIKKLDLEKYLFSYVGELSGGEKQRVLIARALTQEPKILILDEPISNLDLKFQLETMKILKNLAKEKNLIVITILHDLNFAISYSDKILFLKNGKINNFGDTKKIITTENIKEIFSVDIDIVQFKNKNYIIPLE
ncbi:ABC transporter ATP-binding protein [Fusobacterium pseudoperiodonticum]|uniref:Iron ABC transporter n=1 Tax=Fusobacterium pseudoperiodonticum TaxID=2663009 RepID=A0AAD0F222_9FUSO|nr:ABC transporter ATP-binding protein [Fusobacterium pseudoperiodonticum]ATV34852.1 ABC transporter ATP-binding protein [Fusobacterium pseudoperiodonticum]ATV62255.1 iron ABC transporter [Fusobacterium pseudoperiodonticum]